MSPNVHDQCPLCSTAYEDDHVYILQETDVAVLQHSTCQKCQSKMISMQIDSDVGTGSIGMITDLHLDEHYALADKDNVSEDDVLGFHTLLSTNAQTFLSACMPAE